MKDLISFLSYMTYFTLNKREPLNYTFKCCKFPFAASNKAAAVDQKDLRKIRHLFLLQSFCDVFSQETILIPFNKDAFEEADACHSGI